MRRSVGVIVGAAVAALILTVGGAPASASDHAGVRADVTTVHAAAVTPEPIPFDPGVTRLAGVDRYHTSIATSGRYPSGVRVLFVSLGTNFPDALSAASAAAAMGGPLLLTPGDHLPADTLAEVRRLAPAQIYVTGDSRSISDEIVRTLATVSPTQRLGGTDRYNTGKLIVDTAFTSAPHAIIATGSKFPDALAATGAAGSLRAPVILVDGAAATVSAGVLATLNRLGVTSVAIVGDVNSVSAGIEGQLRARNLSVVRYGGVDRYQTASMINDAYFPGSVDTAFITAGANFPDALSAAAVAGRMGAPIYTTVQECLPTAIRESLSAKTPRATVAMGDTKSVGEAAGNSLGCLTLGKPSIGGALVVGGTLKANPGAWTPGTVFSYVWTVDGSSVGNAEDLDVTMAFVGKRVTVQVTGTRAGYVSATASSASTGVVPAPVLTLSQKNAVQKAKSYLKYSGFSRSGLIEQLEYEGFSTADATFGADNAGADWNQEAVESATSYLKYSSFSRSGLIDQLEYEGFTAAEAIYGVDNAGADWNAEAAEAAASYLKLTSFSRAGLYAQLAHDGFTGAQIEFGLAAVGY